jgi:signal transduction histidine kinase
MPWDMAGNRDGALFWNPAAISYLSQLVLALVLAAYLGRRAFMDSRRGRFHAATLLLAILMSALALAFSASLARVMAMGGWLSYAMPWSRLDDWSTLIMPWARPFGGLASLAMVLLAYIFPQRLPGSRRELRSVAALLASLVLIETWIVVRADLGLLQKEAWWAPQWLFLWMHLAMLWAAVVFWRQFLAAYSGPVPDARFRRIVHGIALMCRPRASRDAMTARAFIILVALPIIHTAVLLMLDEGQAMRFAFDMVLCWLVMLQMVGITLVLIGYLPEHTTFLFKLTVIGLAVLLAALNITAWSILPTYQSEFRAERLIRSGEALLFVPRGKGQGYAVQPTVFLPEPVRGTVLAAEGGPIDLPFAFPFYDVAYGRLHIGALGTIGFANAPQPVDAAFDQGRQPAIYPMLVDAPEAGSEITVGVEPDKLVVTRRDRCRPVDRDRCYQIQTILNADGTILIHMLDAPMSPRYEMFNPLGAPWLIGITPGAERAAGPPLLQDHYRDFAAHLDRLFAPFVPLLALLAVVTLIGLPLIFRTFLLAPLERLLAGVRAFRQGVPDAEVPVTFRDELGYLTESFNALTREQTAMRRGLEDEVAERVAEIADMTIRSTKLEERARLSADLHDAVAQTLASASFHASALPSRFAHLAAPDRAAAEHVARLNRHALSEMRLLLSELREEGEQGTLSDRLGALVDSFSRLHGLHIAADITASADLPSDVVAMFHRVAQEVLNNIVKHSGTDEAELVFDSLPDRAMLMVRDRGRGFDPARIGDSGSLGLSIMAERARMIGASLEITAAPGQGCCITMIWMR